MEEELLGTVPCSSLGVEAALRLGTVGGLWGFCSAPTEARRRGLTGIPQASFVAKTVGKFGLQCGFVAGVFSLTRCGLQRYRGKNDWKNSLIAGAVAGAAVSATTRSWSQVIVVATLVSAISAAADIAKTN